MGRLEDTVRFLDKLSSEQRRDSLQALMHDLKQPFVSFVGFSDLILQQGHPPLPLRDWLVTLRSTTMLFTRVYPGIYRTDSLENYVSQVLQPFQEILTRPPPVIAEDASVDTKTRAFLKTIELNQQLFAQHLAVAFGLGEFTTFSFYEHLTLFSNVNKAAMPEGVTAGIDYQRMKRLVTSKPYLELDNLVGNALKHAQCSAIHVDWSYDSGRRAYEVHVVDDGRGIDPEAIYALASSTGVVQSSASLTREEKLRLVFEKGIHNGNGKTAVWGTSEGIGLAAVRAGITTKGGEVTVESPVPESLRKLYEIPPDKPGTVFYFTIPPELVVMN